MHKMVAFGGILIFLPVDIGIMKLGSQAVGPAGSPGIAKSTGGGCRRLHGSRRDKDRGYRDDDSYDSYNNDSVSDDDHRGRRSSGKSLRDRDPLTDSF